MRILLISGHGNGDPGASSVINGTVYKEANEARKVTAALQSVLKKSADVDIYPVNRNAFEDCTNGVLASYANIGSYDYVLEVHFNAFQSQDFDGNTKGVECYITTSESGSTVESLICNKVSNVGLTNRGVKRYDWSVIYNVKRYGVSSALLELCFIDDPDDMTVYLNKFNDIILAIASGITEGFGLEEIKMESNEIEDDDMKIYETLEDLPDWGRPTIEKLLRKKFMAGVGNGVLNIDEGMLRVFVVNDNAGLYGE